MNHERDVRAWLAYAQADRRSARNAMKAADYRDVAFHCQQVAEKSLKAVIVRQTRRRPPHSHNLWRLWQHISDVACPPDVRDALAALSQHYTLSRYPGGGRQVRPGGRPGDDEAYGARVAMVYTDPELGHQIDQYLEFVGHHVRVERAFLHGSYAYGVPRSRSNINLVVLSPDFSHLDPCRRQEHLAVWAWEAEVGDIEALGLTTEEFEAASDLSLVGEARDRGILVYDADHPERTPAVALRERRAECKSVEEDEEKRQ